MSNPYIGEIRMFAGSFAPAGWAFCDGQLMPISENDAMFVLIGTTYGGDGQETFALPDCRGRAPMHQGTGAGLSTRALSEKAGTETVVLTTNQIPIHSHPPLCNRDPGNSQSPQNNVWSAPTTQTKMYSTILPTNAMNVNNIVAVGGSQPHENLMPYLAISFIISLFGIFPSQT